MDLLSKHVSSLSMKREKVLTVTLLISDSSVALIGVMAIGEPTV